MPSDAGIVLNPMLATFAHTGEIWACRNKETGRLVGPALDDDGTNSFLCWPNREQAEKGLDFSDRMYEIGPEEFEVVKIN